MADVEYLTLTIGNDVPVRVPSHQCKWTRNPDAPFYQVPVPTEYRGRAEEVGTMQVAYPDKVLIATGVRRVAGMLVADDVRTEWAAG